MKHRQLHGLAHNLAASLASGTSFVIGYYATDVFEVAAKSHGGSIVVDFLKGSAEGEHVDGNLKSAILIFAKAFPRFCEKHGVHASDFRSFVVRYIADPSACQFVVTIEDRRGRRSSRAYSGYLGERIKTLDPLGRPRPKTFSQPLD